MPHSPVSQKPYQPHCLGMNVQGLHTGKRPAIIGTHWIL